MSTKKLTDVVDLETPEGCAWFKRMEERAALFDQAMGLGHLSNQQLMDSLWIDLMRKGKRADADIIRPYAFTNFKHRNPLGSSDVVGVLERQASAGQRCARELVDRGNEDGSAGRHSARAERELISRLAAEAEAVGDTDAAQLLRAVERSSAAGKFLAPRKSQVRRGIKARTVVQDESTTARQHWLRKYIEFMAEHREQYGEPHQNGTRSAQEHFCEEYKHLESDRGYVALDRRAFTRKLNKACAQWGSTHGISNWKLVRGQVLAWPRGWRWPNDWPLPA